MCTLLESQLDPKSFREVLELNDAVEEFAEKQALSLLASFGNIFVKHEMCLKYGLIIAHRHFDININEILVETLADDHSMTVALPWSVKGSQVSPSDEEFWKTFNLKVNPYVIAQTWSFSKTGELKAFEFLATEKNMHAPPTPFVAELFKALKQLGLESIVGLRRIDNMRGKSSWETTPEGSKANIVRFGLMPKEVAKDKMIQILWYFNEDGLMHKFGGFCFFCKGHTCTHCGECSKSK